MSSITYWHKLVELDDPTRTFAVTEKIKTVCIESAPPEQTQALRYTHLQQALTLFQPDILRDALDMALLFVGFSTLCRRSELVAMDWEHLQPDEDGSGLVYIPSSKGDQEGEGAYLYLSQEAMLILAHWKRLSGQSEGAMFRGVDSGNRINDRLTASGVSRAFKRVAKRLNLSPALFSGHSTRVGAAQEMVENDIDGVKVMLSGRWKHMDMVYRYTQKLQAKKSGAADLAQKIGADGQKLLPTQKHWLK